MSDRVYLQHPTRDDSVGVPVGFSWMACLFGPVWAFSKRLWLIGAVMIPEIDILTSIADLPFDETYGAAVDVIWQKLVLRVPNVNDMSRIKQVAIASTDSRIAAGEWNAAGVEEARCGIARDEQDIALLRQLKV